MSFLPCINPSYDSITGRCYESLKNAECFPPNDRDCCTLGKAISRIFTIAMMSVTTVVDALCWVGMTVTIYPACRIGLKHFANLISIVAFPIFAIKILLGCRTGVNHTRGFFNPPPPRVPGAAGLQNLGAAGNNGVRRDWEEDQIKHEEAVAKDSMLFSSVDGMLEPSIKEMEAGERNVNARDMNGRTMLMVSTNHHNSDLMKRVLAQNPNTLLRDTSGRNVLFYATHAAMRGDTEKLDLVADREHDPDCVDGGYQTAMSILLLGLSQKNDEAIANHLGKDDTRTIPLAKRLMAMDVSLDYRQLDAFAKLFSKGEITQQSASKFKNELEAWQKDPTLLPPNPYTTIPYINLEVAVALGDIFGVGNDDQRWTEELAEMFKEFNADSPKEVGTMYRLISMRDKLSEAHRAVVGERATIIATQIWGDQVNGQHKSIFRIVVECLIGPERPIITPIPTYAYN